MFRVVRPVTLGDHSLASKRLLPVHPETSAQHTAQYAIAAQHLWQLAVQNAAPGAAWRICCCNSISCSFLALTNFSSFFCSRACCSVSLSAAALAKSLTGGFRSRVGSKRKPTSGLLLLVLMPSPPIQGPQSLACACNREPVTHAVNPDAC